MRFIKSHREYSLLSSLSDRPFFVRTGGILLMRGFSILPITEYESVCVVEKL